MRIVCISNAMLPSERANSVNIVKMAEAFSSLGHEVILIYPTFNAKDQSEEIIQYYNIRKRFTLLGFKVRNQIGWLYIYGLKTFMYCKNNTSNNVLIFSRFPFALFLVSYLKKNVIAELHGEIWKLDKLHELSLKRILKSTFTHKIILISPELCEIYATKFKHIKHSKLIFEPHYSAANITTSTDKYILKGSCSINIGYVGSFNQGRGIEIIYHLAENFPEIGFHLAGGPQTGKLLEETSLYENVFYYGHLPHNDTYSFRNACNILLAPYQEDVKIPSGINTASFMSPIKIFEYMSSQKPFLVSDLPALKKVVDNEMCYLCNPKDLEQWKTAIMNILQFPEIAVQKVINAHEKLMNNYTWEIRAKNILKNIEIKP